MTEESHNHNHSSEPHPQEAPVKYIPLEFVSLVKERNAAEDERDELRGELEDAMIDPVTGIKNEKAFQKEFPSYFSRGPVGVIYGDIDGLRRTNNTVGHPKGDALLRAVAQAFKGKLRVGDEVYRQGKKADEFVAVAPGIPADKLIDLMDRLQSAIDEQVRDLGLESLHVGISLGGAVTQEGDTPEKLVSRAEAHSRDVKDAHRAFHRIKPD